jgi:PAS domain S-box-containing protein
VTYQKELLDTVSNTADGVFAVDANQRIIKWNSGAERILKYSSDQVLNHDCYRVIAGHISPEKLWCRANCKARSCVIKGTPLENFDLLTRANGGEPIWINVSIVSPPPGSEPITVHVFRDITREKRAGQAVDQFLAALGIAGGNGHETPTNDAACTKSSGARVTPTESTPDLSSREIEVLTLLAEGLSTKILAERLAISHFTVRNHIQNILVKLDLHSKAQAVSYAFKRGLL